MLAGKTAQDLWKLADSAIFAVFQEGVALWGNNLPSLPVAPCVGELRAMGHLC